MPTEEDAAFELNKNKFIVYWVENSLEINMQVFSFE